MARKSQYREPSLFDERAPFVKLCPTCEIEIAGAVEALLREIATMLTNGRSGESINEQDHR
jgi:hypothetical protein